MHRSATVQVTSEPELIEKAKRGDPLAFESLYNTHKRRVYSLCLRMTGNTEDAEELTQEAFLQLFRKIESFRGDAAFSTWLHRLTVNLVLMRFRKKGLITTSLDEPISSENDSGASREIGVQDEMLNGTVDRLVLENAIQSLPAGYRMVFYLHDVEGYEHKEIAGIMGCSVGNCKSQLHKARMKLRQTLVRRTSAVQEPR
ncbi:MAG: RNA polymerase subunit sigma-24 [Acidobacteria bacterium RIFCSPLOWO2_12_FULL_54_10]|nr:MAG: RNA polymerase subunit sigma-24 [Acidobacteria bacterium RIFCSPLOWO2_12_FULL_54_10]